MNINLMQPEHTIINMVWGQTTKISTLQFIVQNFLHKYFQVYSGNTFASGDFPVKKRRNSLLSKDNTMTDPRVAGTKYSRAGWATFMNASAINVTTNPTAYASVSKIIIATS